MTGAVLLHVALGAPLAGTLGLALVPRRIGERRAPITGVVASGVALAALVAVVVLADKDDGGRAQFVTDAAWAPAVDLRWHLGVTGLSLPFAVLTALLVFCCCLYTVRVRPEAGRLRAFIAVVLLLEVGLLGTFLAPDLLLFFLFLEVVLEPMWGLLAWSHTRASDTWASWSWASPLSPLRVSTAPSTPDWLTASSPASCSSWPAPSRTGTEPVTSTNWVVGSTRGCPGWARC